MKITYILLRNFANIKTAYHSDEISIDLTKCKNKIILITGPNGSGKTSILSCMHPFATNGNLDVRSENPLIVSGEDGYKEIRIEDDGDEYVIKHFYTASKDSHTVKSYIEKNGNELNVNGNVKSFKDIIHEELGIEMDYLKLTRLGSNVTNFIDLKTTDRKSFMGKILDEVDIYLKYYKKIVADMREVKSVISHTVDKITKLSIGDIDEAKKSQKERQKQIETLKSALDSMKSQLDVIEYEISKYDSILEVKENLDIKKKECVKAEKLVQKGKLDSKSLEEMREESTELEKNLVQIESDIAHSREKRKELLDVYDKLICDSNEIKDELDKIAESADVKNLEYMISELRAKIQKRDTECSLSKYDNKVSKEELEDLIVMLDKCSEMVLTMYEFGKEPIKKAASYILSNTDISEYVTSNKQKSEKSKFQNAAEVVYQYILKKIGPVKTKCTDACDIKDFYNTLFDLVTEEPDVVIEDEAFVTYVKMSHQTIMGLLKNLRDCKSTLEKLPTDIQKDFILQTFMDNIVDMKPIYNKQAIYSLLTIATEYDLQQTDLAELDRLKEKLKLTKLSIGNSEYLSNKIGDISDELEKTADSLTKINEEIETLESDRKDTIEDIEFHKEFIEALESREKLVLEVEKLQDSYDELTDFFRKKKDLLQQYDRLKYEYEKALKEFNDTEYRIKSYLSFNEDLSAYNTKYDEMELVKNALSAKEGIPLLYIQIYLKSIQEITNELLEIVYDDELYIENFNITADEFKIPYTTKGTEIGDVCYASQGERSFISLAFSFALIYQSISKYNIMLLDEIDSTLDTSNREKFLQILEKQMNMIDGEQIFVISHNNMFNMYPVDIIDTKNNTDADNRLANYIRIMVK
jgi:recombinational DNA repair ATPase RecF